jgi:hypothetical protein
MAADLQAIAGQLQASLDPQQSRQGMLQTHHITYIIHTTSNTCLS